MIHNRLKSSLKFNDVAKRYYIQHMHYLLGPHDQQINRHQQDITQFPVTD